MKMIPIYDDSVPISCTIDSGEIAQRIELIERLRVHLTELEQTEHGMLLRFPNRADIADDVRRFAADEKSCCAFWGFEVTTTEAEVRLRWDAPAAAGELVTQLVAYFEGDIAITAIEGLL